MLVGLLQMDMIKFTICSEASVIRLWTDLRIKRTIIPNFCVNIFNFTFKWHVLCIYKSKSKTNHLQAWTGPQGCWRLRLQELPDNRLTKVARLSALPTSHFCPLLLLVLISVRGWVYSRVIGNRTHDLPACSAIPQPTAPLRTPLCLCKVR